jgi:trypsin
MAKETTGDGRRPAGFPHAYSVILGLCAVAALALALSAPAVAWAGEEDTESRIEVGPGVYLAPAAELASSDRDRPLRPKPTRVGPVRRIVGGSPTTIARWPWQASIGLHPDLFPGPTNGFERHMCGGALVAPRIVVSAAHCFFDDLTRSFFPPNEHQVITGRTQLSSSAGQVHDLANYFVFTDRLGFPLFNSRTMEWDVIILLLASRSSEKTIKVAGPHEIAAWGPGQEAFITGWGTTAEDGELSDVLRQASIKMIADQTCRLLYGAEFSPALMICAGELAGGVDACQGDSGGPLVVSIAGEGYRLVGDTSWGDGCARPNRPGVYGRLADEPIRGALREAILAVAGVDVVAAPPNHFDFGALNLNRKRGIARLTVRVPGSGRVVLERTRQLRRFARQARAAGPVRLLVRPRGKAQRRVSNRRCQRSGEKQLRVRVRARVTYHPIGGTPRTQQRPLRLVKSC